MNDLYSKAGAENWCSGLPAQQSSTPQEVDSHVLDERARIAAGVATNFAAIVDESARFPTEAITMLREQGLLGAMVPKHLGGLGASLGAIASVCNILGQACSSTAMIYAMHQIQVACIVEHAITAPWHRNFLKQLVRNEWLLASATSEEGVGGNLRNSRCSIESANDAFVLRKLTPTISYGAYADATLATARRDPSASATDQILVTLLRDATTLTSQSGWNTLGMRGTCSDGFVLESMGRVEQVFPVPFAQIAEQTMVPISHILWSSAWTGIANDAFSRAHRYFRSQSPEKNGILPPSARRISKMLALLQAMQCRIDEALRQRSAQNTERSWSASMADAAEINTLKTFVSTTSLRVVHHAMMVCGMAAYKNETPFSLSRHLRDLYSAPLMINNDRIDINTANLLLAQRTAFKENGL